MPSQVFPISFISFSTVRRHVILGRPRLRFPSGVQCIAVFAMEASWRVTWPIHLQRLLIRMVAIDSVSVSDGTIRLKRNHDYYIQVQGQDLNIESIHVIVYFGEEMPLFKEKMFMESLRWNQELLPRLEFFFQKGSLSWNANQKGWKRQTFVPPWRVAAIWAIFMFSKWTEVKI